MHHSNGHDSTSAATAAAAPPIKPARRDKVLLAIALFKFAKSALLVCIAIGAMRLLHGGFSGATIAWLERLASEPEHRVLRKLLEHVLTTDARKLREIRAASLIYAVLLTTEGTGLWLGRRWGEYFTILITGSFIPFELREVIRHPSLGRISLTLVNVAAVVYLVWRVRRERKAQRR